MLKFKEVPEVAAFHPGPDADHVNCNRLRETPSERLERYEASFMRIAVERYADRCGDLGDLARQIIVARAQITG